MKKFKFFIDYDKEETWLNIMSKKGYELESVFFTYKFRSIKPENSIFKIDYRTFKKKENFIDYCVLFEDTGWKHIAGSKYSGTQYFKKIDENSQEDIFSDAISKAGKYKRLSDMYMALAVVYLTLSMSSISSGRVNFNSMINPRSWYFTPGLWERTGVGFWFRFLFETPFVFLRSSWWLLLVLFLFVYSSIKARVLYNKQKNRE